MDLELLNRRDKNEWDRAFPELYGPARRNVGSLNAPICKSQLPLETMDDLATEAVTLAFHKPVQFNSVGHLVAFVVLTAKNLTRTFAKSAYGRRSIAGLFTSLDAPQADGAPSPEPPPHSDQQPQPVPDQIARQAEYLTVAGEVLLRLDARDRELLQEKFIQELPEHEIAARHGWETNTVGSRIKQACGRVKKLLKSDPKLSTLIKELGFEHHFDE